MGCDIHLFAEKKENGVWISIDKYTPNPEFGKYHDEKEFVIDHADRIYTKGRNYNLFCALAGVRGFHFYGEPSIISEPKGLPEDCCTEIKTESDNYGADGHSHSWNTLKELEDFDWSGYGETVVEFKKEVFPKLKEASADPENVRIVYFFDN